MWERKITDLSALIESHKDELTTLERRVAAYIIANPSCVAVETAAVLANRAGVSAMTITRFFKKLGFNNAAAAKSAVKQRIIENHPFEIGQRFDTAKRHRAKPPAPRRRRGNVADRFHQGLGNDRFGQAVAMGIRRIEAYRTEPIWRDVVRLVANAGSVFVSGVQAAGYLASGLMAKLSYLRPNVHEIDGLDGTYGKLFTDPAPRRVLVLIDVFRYGQAGPILARAAREHGVDVVVFCDDLCDWASPLTPYVLALPSDATLMFGPTTAIHFGFDLLVLDVGEALGDAAQRQLEVLSRAQETFGQYLR